jgi:hypothetical protein
MSRFFGIPPRPPTLTRAQTRAIYRRCESLTSPMPRRDDWPLIVRLFVVALAVGIGLAWLTTMAP